MDKLNFIGQIKKEEKEKVKRNTLEKQKPKKKEKENNLKFISN